MFFHSGENSLEAVLGWVLHPTRLFFSFDSLICSSGSTLPPVSGHDGYHFKGMQVTVPLDLFSPMISCFAYSSSIFPSVPGIKGTRWLSLRRDASDRSINEDSGTSRVYKTCRRFAPAMSQRGPGRSEEEKICIQAVNTTL
jgi:hypothetical protein